MLSTDGKNYGDILVETEDFRVCATGHDYDFASFIENRTEHPIFFGLDLDASDSVSDRENVNACVYYQTDEINSEDCSRREIDLWLREHDGFEIAAYDWAGLFRGHMVEA